MDNLVVDFISLYIVLAYFQNIKWGSDISAQNILL